MKLINKIYVTLADWYFKKRLYKWAKKANTHNLIIIDISPYMWIQMQELNETENIKKSDTKES